MKLQIMIKMVLKKYIMNIISEELRFGKKLMFYEPKRFYIEENFFPGFIKNFNLKLSIYGIDFFTDKNNQI